MFLLFRWRGGLRVPCVFALFLMGALSFWLSLFGG